MGLGSLLSPLKVLRKYNALITWPEHIKSELDYYSAVAYVGKRGSFAAVHSE